MVFSKQEGAIEQYKQESSLKTYHWLNSWSRHHETDHQRQHMNTGCSFSEGTARSQNNSKPGDPNRMKIGTVVHWNVNQLCGKFETDWIIWCWETLWNMNSCQTHFLWKANLTEGIDGELRTMSAKANNFDLIEPQRLSCVPRRCTMLHHDPSLRNFSMQIE